MLGAAGAADEEVEVGVRVEIRRRHFFLALAVGKRRLTSGAGFLQLGLVSAMEG